VELILERRHAQIALLAAGVTALAGGGVLISPEDQQLTKFIAYGLVFIGLACFFLISLDLMRFSAIWRWVAKRSSRVKYWLREWLWPVIPRRRKYNNTSSRAANANLSAAERADDSFSRRITLMRLANLASEEYAWQFSGNSLHAIDFLNALAQGIQDDVIILEGRRGCAHLPIELFDRYPLKKIPKQHFEDFFIDIPGMLHFDIDNRQTQTKPFQKDSDWSERFCDLHFQNRDAAIYWLANEAEHWKGRSDAFEKDRRKRAENFE
jgi:hypothetical protein